MISKKYESQTAKQQDKNLSNQKRVFDPRFRHGDFPPNFWFGKHHQRCVSKTKESGSMTNKIVKKIKHYPGSELKNKPFSKF